MSSLSSLSLIVVFVSSHVKSTFLGIVSVADIYLFFTYSLTDVLENFQKFIFFSYDHTVQKHVYESL